VTPSVRVLIADDDPLFMDAPRRSSSI